MYIKKIMAVAKLNSVFGSFSSSFVTEEKKKKLVDSWKYIFGYSLLFYFPIRLNSL